MQYSRRLAMLFALAAGLFVLPAGAATRNLYLAATDGFVWMPDDGSGNGIPRQVWIRGFVADTAPGACAANTRTAGPPPAGFLTSTDPGNPCNSPLQGAATLPAPIIDVDLGDDVFLTLSNVGNKVKVAPDPHTVHLHGLKSTTQNDGFNESAWFVPIGYQATYYFKAERAGSFMYHCHVEASEHVQMGMYGALIIRPTALDPAAAVLLGGRYPARTNTVYGGGFNDWFDNGPDGRPQEYIMLLSDIDPVWHAGVQNNFAGTFIKPNNQGGNPDSIDLSKFNPTDYKPGYWLVNGRSFPDTLAPTVSGPGPSKPGDGPPDGYLAGSNNLATYRTFINVAMGGPNQAPGTGPRFLVRVIGVGFQPIAHHFHGFLFRAVGKDANGISLLQQRSEQTLNMASGETYDLIIAPDCLKNYGRDGAQSFSPGVVQTPGAAQGAVGGALWPGVAEPVFPTGNDLSVQVWPVHSHYDYQVTNYGAYPGGALSLIRASNPACK